MGNLINEEECSLGILSSEGWHLKRKLITRKLSFQVCLLVKLIENKREDIKGNIYPSFETTLVDIHLEAGNSLPIRHAL